MIAALFCMMFGLVSSNASAQRQGGGNNPAGTPLTFESVLAVNGKTPQWSGDFTLGPNLSYGTWITTLSFSIRGKNLNLPDNTPLYVNLYTSNVATGETTDTSSVRYHCMANPMQVVGKLGIVKAYTNFYDDPFAPTIVRKLDKVEIIDASGTVLAIAHP